MKLGMKNPMSGLLQGDDQLREDLNPFITRDAVPSLQKTQAIWSLRKYVRCKREGE